MTSGEAKRGDQPYSPPASTFSGPAAELIAQGTLSGPDHPGAIAKIDHLDLLRLLRAGGMGFVFLARDTRKGDKVAVKMLRPEFGTQPRVVHRFLTEARHLQRIHHPHIVPVLEVSERKEAAYMVMPYYGQGSLDSLLAEGEPLPDEQALEIAQQVAEALRVLHSKGIVHRDIKPGNVLLDDEGRVRLADLGLAQTLFNDSLVNVENTQPEGTAPYMSPAVAAGEAEDTRCDIYSFGALLYEVLTGKPPYEASSAKGILQQVIAGPPTPIVKVNPRADQGLAVVAEGAMGRTHGERYASMIDVLLDLQRVAAGEWPAGPGGRARARRTKRIAMVGIAGVFLLGCLTAGILGASPLLRPRLVTMGKTETTAPMHNPEEEICYDIDADQSEEFLFAEGDGFRVLSFPSKLSRTVQLKAPHVGPIKVTLAEDITSDGVPEVFASWSDGSNAWTGALNQEGWPVKSFSFPSEPKVHKKYGVYYTLLAARRIADLDDDGKPELLASVETPWSGPRGLCCFDVNSGERRWYFETAPTVREMEVLDLVGDSKKEIVLGSHSVWNGVTLPDGSDDARAYVFLVSHSGEPLWRTNLAYHFSHVLPVPGEAGQLKSQQFLVWVTSHPQTDSEGPPIVGKVVAFDANFKATTYDAGVQLRSCLKADLDGDGHLEILATDVGGSLHVLDSALSRLNRFPLAANPFSWVDLRLAGIGLFSGKKETEILVTSSQVETRGRIWDGSNPEKRPVHLYHDNCVLVLDSHMRLIARRVFADVAPASDGFPLRALALKSPGDSRILVLGREAEFLQFRRW